MKITKIYTGEDRQSHFEELDIELFDAKYGKLTAPIMTKHLIFGEVEDLQDVGWHNPPHRQFIIMLQGAMEIEISDGTKRIFNEGDILLAEDVDGQGHITRAASEGVRRYVMIPLEA